MIYSAISEFNSSVGERWTEFVSRSGLFHLKEVVSLDQALCPNAISTLVPEDWEYNVNEDYRIFFFRDLEYLSKRITGRQGVIIVGLLEEPQELDVLKEKQHQLIGFDVVDAYCDSSALTNCGDFFDRAFRGEELNSSGLIARLDRAYEIKRSLRALYPDEPHADCLVWGVWRT